MEEILRDILFGINLFYPFLLLSVMIFTYSIYKRSWIWMCLSSIITIPHVLYLLHFPFPLNLSLIYFGLQVLFMLRFYIKKGAKEIETDA